MCSNEEARHSDLEQPNKNGRKIQMYESRIFKVTDINSYCCKL